MDEFFNSLSVDDFLGDYLEVEYFEGVTVDELIAYTNCLGRIKGSEHNSKDAKLLTKHGNLK